ncbi:MAG: hypothetical protein R2849_15325 [Thermomicrobiales bacterium]
MRRAVERQGAEDVGDDVLDLLVAIAEGGQGGPDRLVGDLEAAAAGQLRTSPARSRSLTPVVSQSISRPIVPVGASSVVLGVLRCPALLAPFEGGPRRRGRLPAAWPGSRGRRCRGRDNGQSS